jgi:hypothetical protein
MKFLEWPRLSVWLTGLAAQGLGTACGDTVQLSNLTPSAIPPQGYPEAGVLYPPDDAAGDSEVDAEPTEPEPAYDARPLADSGSMGDAAPPSDAGTDAASDAASGLRGFGRVRVSGDPDASGFDASVSALFTRQSAEPRCDAERIGPCTVYRCDPASGSLPEPVAPASVRIWGALGECTLSFDPVNGSGRCASTFWNFDAPIETLGVMSAGGAFPVFRADFVVPTRATLSEPAMAMQMKLLRTSTHFAWSGGTAGEVELTLRGCMPGPSPSHYAVCTAPVYGSVLDVPQDVLKRLSDLTCLSGTLSSFVAMTQTLGDYQVDLRVELGFRERFLFESP